MFKKSILCMFIIMILIMIGCDSTDDSVNKLERVPMNSLDIDDNFDFQSTKEIDVSISVILRNGEPLDGIIFEIYNRNPDEDGARIAAGTTDENGNYFQTITLPSYYDSLVVLGFMSTLTLPIIGDQAAYVFGQLDRDLTGAYVRHDRKRNGFIYLDPHNSDGVPDSLETDIISGEFLTRVNTSLPESKPVPDYHPDYLNPSAVNNIIIDEFCDVWVTFIHEGAGFKNALGFYTYNQIDGAPATAAELTHYIIFPNASLNNSGGSLLSGDKVYLGQFDEGTVIGWFLVANGWNGSTVSETKVRWYSNPEFNTTEDDQYKQHTVLLYDAQNEKLLLGIEDLKRSTGSDNDFNDAVFYVTANPPEAVETEQINPIDQPGDGDGDGITDIYDDYPEDFDRAFDFFYPAENYFGTLAFEDLWPQQGDYDLNDLVVDYNFKNIHNSDLKLIEIEGTIKLRAVGGSNQNGFAIEFPFSVGEIESWEGYFGDDSYPMGLFDANGKAVLRIIDNTNDIIQIPGGGIYFNTQPEYQYMGIEKLSFVIALSQALDMNDFEYQAPFNPFIIVNQNEGLEVHLSNYTPTSNADLAYFQTEDDDSDASIGRFYRTEKNLPWAINIPESWNYPIESKEITWGYLAFPNWSQSGGSTYEEWYKLIENQINSDYIYIIRK